MGFRAGGTPAPRCLGHDCYQRWVRVIAAGHQKDVDQLRHDHGDADVDGGVDARPLKVAGGIGVVVVRGRALNGRLQIIKSLLRRRAACGWLAMSSL